MASRAYCCAVGAGRPTWPRWWWAVIASCLVPSRTSAWSPPSTTRPRTSTACSPGAVDGRAALPRVRGACPVRHPGGHGIHRVRSRGVLRPL